MHLPGLGVYSLGVYSLRVYSLGVYSLGLPILGWASNWLVAGTSSICGMDVTFWIKGEAALESKIG